MWESRNAAAEFVSSNSWTFKKKETRLSSETRIFPLVSFSFSTSLLTRFTGKFRFLTDCVESIKLWGTHLFYFCWQFSFVSNTHCASVVGFKLALAARFWPANSDDRSFFSIKSYEFADTQSQFFVTKELGKCFCLCFRRGRLQKKFLNCFGKKTTVIEVLPGNILQFPWV